MNYDERVMKHVEMQNHTLDEVIKILRCHQDDGVVFSSESSRKTLADHLETLVESKKAIEQMRIIIGNHGGHRLGY